MAITPEYREYLTELFATAGAIEIRRVFRFGGLYLGEVMFGLVADERVYLKTDKESRKAYESEGEKPLLFRGRGKRIATSYWSIPERLYDEPEELAEWARRAHEIALKSPTTARKRARKTKRKSTRQPVRRRTHS